MVCSAFSNSCLVSSWIVSLMVCPVCFASSNASSTALPANARLDSRPLVNLFANCLVSASFGLTPAVKSLTCSAIESVASSGGSSWSIDFCIIFLSDRKTSSSGLLRWFNFASCDAVALSSEQFLIWEKKTLLELKFLNKIYIF